MKDLVRIIPSFFFLFPFLFFLGKVGKKEKKGWEIRKAGLFIVLTNGVRRAPKVKEKPTIEDDGCGPPIGRW